MVNLKFLKKKIVKKLETQNFKNPKSSFVRTITKKIQDKKFGLQFVGGVGF